jgi:tetratricopeptide (TPR) repeat protein
VAQLRHERGSDDQGAAHALARKAAELAPQLPDVHVALGAVELRSGSHRSAIRCFRRALQLKPDHADALGYLGRVLLEVGDLEQAVRMLERTLTIDPETRGVARDLARGLALLGRWDEAHAVLERAAASEGSGVAYDVARSRLAAWEGDRETVLRVHAELLRRDYTDQLRGFIVCAGLAAMQNDEARALLATSRGLLTSAAPSAPTIRMLASQVLAEAASGLGDTALAREALDFAIDAGLVDRNWLDRCPALAALREEGTLTAQRATLAARAEEAVRGLVDPLDD